MGLYESEISKQIHLRNQQKKEWIAMKKKYQPPPSKRLLPENVEKQFEDERRLDDSLEIQETQVSKKLSGAMMRSARGGLDDTLLKAVDLLNNQNGTYLMFFYNFN